MKQRIKVHEGNTGILYFENGEKFVPNYDVDKARELALEILNVSSSDGRKVRDLFHYDGFNWASVILSELFWSLCYTFTLYSELLQKYHGNQPIIEYKTNQFVGGRFQSIYSFINDENSILIDRQDDTNNQSILNSSINRIKKIIKWRPGIRTFIRTHILKINRIGKLYEAEIIFDVSHRDNFRTAYIEKALDELGLNLTKAPIQISKHYETKENIFNYRYNLSIFEHDEFLHEFVSKSLKRIEEIISQSIFSYEKHVKIISEHRPKLFLSMDEANSHVFPLLYACKKFGIPTVGFQHGVYTKRHFGYSHFGLENFTYDWFDKVLVWGDYWKNKLCENRNLENTEVISFANKHGRFEYEDFCKNRSLKSSLNILFPYEFLADSFEVGKYINRLFELGHKIYFKSRSDEKVEDEIAAYHVDLKYRDKMIVIETVDNILLESIDAIMGVQTTYLFELFPYKIPIFFPETDFKLIDDMVDEGLAQRIKLSQLESLPELVYSYEYKGRKPDYYFTRTDLKEKLQSFLKPYME